MPHVSVPVEWESQLPAEKVSRPAVCSQALWKDSPSVPLETSSHEDAFLLGLHHPQRGFWSPGSFNVFLGHGVSRHAPYVAKDDVQLLLLPSAGTIVYNPVCSFTQC